MIDHGKVKLSKMGHLSAAHGAEAGQARIIPP
jgi:hypothetical protein